MILSMEVDMGTGIMKGCARLTRHVLVGWAATVVMPPLSGAAIVQPRPDDACVPLMLKARSPTAPADDRAAARRCVDSVDAVRHNQPLRSIANEASRLAQIHFTIPEYHDEQRLSDGSGGLGPQANIYASPYWGGFNDFQDIVEHSARGVLAAFVVVQLQKDEVLPPTYQELLLSEGMNCVWLARVSAIKWNATISKPNARGHCIAGQNVAGGTLEVQRTQEPGFPSFGDYPPVARFGESMQGWPLLGVRCLNGWCEIGKPGFVPRPALSAAGGTREHKIKGWHDEQRLVVADASGRLVPDVRAAIVPVPGIADMRLSDLEQTPITVAEIILESDPAINSKYYNWGLRQGTNQLQLFKAQGTYDRWRTRIVTQSGASTGWRDPTRMNHWDAALPSTARFRWTIGDDGMWVPCGQACCHVQGPGW
jgi:hypothetical protein